MTFPAIVISDHLEVALVPSSSGLARKVNQIVDLNGGHVQSHLQMRGAGGIAKVNDLGLMSIIGNTRSLVLSGEATSFEDVNKRENHVRADTALVRALGSQIVQAGPILETISTQYITSENAPLDEVSIQKMTEILKSVKLILDLSQVSLLPQGEAAHTQRLNNAIQELMDVIANQPVGIQMNILPILQSVAEIIRPVIVEYKLDANFISEFDHVIDTIIEQKSHIDHSLKVSHEVLREAPIDSSPTLSQKQNTPSASEEYDERKEIVSESSEDVKDNEDPDLIVDDYEVSFDIDESYPEIEATNKVVSPDITFTDIAQAVPNIALTSTPVTRELSTESVSLAQITMPETDAKFEVTTSLKAEISITEPSTATINNVTSVPLVQNIAHEKIADVKSASSSLPVSPKIDQNMRVVSHHLPQLAFKNVVSIITPISRISSVQSLSIKPQANSTNYKFVGKPAPIQPQSSQRLDARSQVVFTKQPVVLNNVQPVNRNQDVKIPAHSMPSLVAARKQVQEIPVIRQVQQNFSKSIETVRSFIEARSESVITIKPRINDNALPQQVSDRSPQRIVPQYIVRAELPLKESFKPIATPVIEGIKQKASQFYEVIRNNKAAQVACALHGGVCRCAEKFRDVSGFLVSEKNPSKIVSVAEFQADRKAQDSLNVLIDKMSHGKEDRRVTERHENDLIRAVQSPPPSVKTNLNVQEIKLSIPPVSTNSNDGTAKPSKSFRELRAALNKDLKLN